MSLKAIAYVFGVFFLLVGILGFVPGLTTDGSLFGIFDVSFMHNVIHILTGVLALVVVMISEKATKVYFQVFGVVYALVTVIGFIQGTTVLGLFGVNMADNLLHLATAAVALYAGFGVKTSDQM